MPGPQRRGPGGPGSASGSGAGGGERRDRRDNRRPEGAGEKTNYVERVVAIKRVAKVVKAEEIKEADKLLRLTVDVGGKERQIIAGIKAAYKAESLVGRHVLIVANLKPRKMKFGMSEGMVLAAGDGGSDLFIFSPDEGAKSGSRVK